MTKQGFQGNSKLIKKRSSLFTLRRILLRLSYKKECLGFNVAMFLPSAEDKQKVFAKIETALEMILRFAPHRIGRMRRQVKRIWVFDATPYRAEWQEDLKACVMDRDYVRSEQTSPELIAATIMHEATHARVQSAGIDYEEKLRVRIERLCVKSEIWLVKRLPNGGELLNTKESKLLMYDEFSTDAFWTDHAFQERNLDALRELGQDRNWIVRLFANSVDGIVARRRAKKLSDRSRSGVASTDKED